MGLRHKDLKDTIYNIVGIDEYDSKMGNNENVVTLSFKVHNRQPADDLCNFLEKGYNEILDADVSPGEMSDGHYLVFVEIPRDRKVCETIVTILDDVKKLADIEEFKFRYYKQFKSHVANLENLSNIVPSDPDEYGLRLNENDIDNYENFFKRGFLENISINDNVLHLKKRYGETLSFEIIDFDDAEVAQKRITESFNIMDSYAEIVYLTKCLGNYNISKYGDKLVFENQTKLLILRRI